MDNPRYWNAGSSAELLKHLQERSDDIERVIVGTGDGFFIRSRRTGSKIKLPGRILIETCNHEYMTVITKADAEILLNDGILNRMGIKIERL